jgi:hypothetical protein
VHVRRSFNGWSDQTQLQQEGATRFYSAMVKRPFKAGGAPDTIMYKFTYTKSGSVNWESISDRQSIIKNDTTLYWKWFNDAPYVAPVVSDTVVVTFAADMARAISERGFAIGDTLVVRSGYNATAKEVREKRLTRQGVSTVYLASDSVIAAIGKTLNYQYYVIKNGVDYREVYFDFNNPDPTSASAERRRINVTGKTFAAQDTTSNILDSRRKPRFRSMQKLTKSVTVTYTVDVRPAYYTVKNASKKLVATNVTPYVIGNADSVISWGVWMNGPAVGGWDQPSGTGWGPGRRSYLPAKMWDDGPAGGHGDAVAGDSVFSLKFVYKKDSVNSIVGQEFKFGIGGFDNEGGFGNNHIENISDADTVFTIPSQFGSIDPRFYNAWNFDLKKPQTPTSVEGEAGVPLVYELRQNYPNPFNPTTSIQFTLPEKSSVTLKVFNMLGQEVATVVSGEKLAGVHTVQFDASSMASGIYFYQIKAGDFLSLRKMVLIK